MGWYREGKVNVVVGQTSVTGVGTNFAANTLTGDAFIGPDGQWYEVINVPSPTTLSISPAYRSASVSNANYALMPVQGYQRDLAIVAGSIIQQWGATLAGLGAVSTENVVPVSKGGTGGTTQELARTNLGLKSAAVAAIVGATSQAGGIPTGSIIERGASAGGEYVKFADGTMICTRIIATASYAFTVAVGALWRSPTMSLGLAATFVTPPAVIITASRPADDDYAITARVGVITASTLSCYLTSNLTAASLGVSIIITSIGRWF